MTTSQLRKSITVHSFAETTSTINIAYSIKGKDVTQFLPVDKVENVDLMELVDKDAPICQRECIDIVVLHEQNKSNRGYLDITKPDSLFESIAGIVRTHNKVAYGL